MNVKSLLAVVLLIVPGVVSLAFAWGEWSQVRAASAEPKEIALADLLKSGTGGPRHVQLIEYKLLNSRVTQAKINSEEWAAVYIPLLPPASENDVRASGALPAILKSTHASNPGEALQLAARKSVDAVRVDAATAIKPAIREALAAQFPNTDFTTVLVLQEGYQPSPTTAIVLTVLSAVLLIGGMAGLALTRKTSAP